MTAANTFFDWAVSLTRFVKRDTARSDEVNDALDSISNGFTAAEALTNAAIKLSAGETSAALGNAAARKGKVLSFHATTGAAEASIATTDVATIAANIADVNTVAGISANVTSVAANAANVNTVAGISGNVTTVAGISGNVTTVAGISAAVSTVATNATPTATVATNIANVNTVAGISAAVTTVAGISGNVTTVAGIGGAVVAVATITPGAVSTVSGIAANVTTVAGISANTTTVAGIAAAVSTVSTNATAVSTVSTNIASVNTAATNIAAIIAAPTEATNAAASAVLAQNYAAAIQSTSVTSLAIAIASKTFATQASKQFAAGQFVTASSAANAANYMHGQVTSYTGTSLVVNVLDIGGSGTLADWNISISGTQGTTGAAGTLSGNASGAISMVDQQFSRALVIDCGYVYLDKGNSGTSTQTFDCTAGSVQKVTATGNHTFAFSNWPPTGNEGYMRVDFANYGAYTITPPTVTWTNPDGTETTSLSAHFTALAAAGGRAGFTASGLTKAIFWCKDAGTTVYGRFI